MRAMATAVLLFIANLIGYGFGPLFIGFTSDVFFVSGAADLGVTAQELARNDCHPRSIGALSENLQSVCGSVYAQSLQSAMVNHGYLIRDKFAVLSLDLASIR